MKKNHRKVIFIASVVLALSIVSITAYGADVVTPNKYPAKPIDEVEFYGNPASSIASGVAVPADSAYLFTSGTVPPLLNKDGKTVYERYGDTKTQSIGILKRIEADLKEKGLTLSDVIYLRVYLVADPAKENKVDYQGWFDAYGQFFGTESNPTKTARSTMAVAGLVSSDWLVEIEAVAVYPKKE
ncbi:RidA family protein [Paenibacillus turpanensis]|uniref:RidA family protein n=1 Tax=Paenibacillus turpanensis TaxID=2689078 RepID=UPI00140A233C|nr:RidA family protein [Paenibacillus turpanensis]